MAKFIPKEDGLSVEGAKDGKIQIEIQGVKTWKEGAYRNATQTMTASPETAREMIGDIEKALDQIESER